MSLRAEPFPSVPEDTTRVARAAFRRGNPYLLLRDRLGAVFADADFADLYPWRGQPAYAPWRLAPGADHADAVPRGAERPAGGRRRARPDRLEVPARSCSRRRRLRLLSAVRVPCPPARAWGCRAPARPPAGRRARGRAVEGPRAQPHGQHPRAGRCARAQSLGAPHEVDAAATPGGARERAGDGRLQPLMGVGDDELGALQAALGEGLEERAPRGVSACEGPMCSPTISRRPSGLTATAPLAAAETMRPPSRTLRWVASSQR